MRVAFSLNGAPVEADVAPRERLSTLLREKFDLVSVREGCAIGRCGTCLVLIDDAPANACLFLAARLDGAAITTVEGLGNDREPVVAALAEEGAVQCGYCSPALVVALTWASRQRLDAAEAAAAIVGQICRCTGYRGTLRAIARLTAAARQATD